jgi:hypothetical protein
MYFSNGGNGNDWVAWHKSNQLLDKMWNIPVTEDDIISGRKNRYEYFEKEGDTRVAELIFRATLMDVDQLGERNGR